MTSGGGLGNKRKLDEWEVSNVEESKAAIVHGIVTQLSPVCVSKKNSSVRYFDGKVAGERKCARLLCFDPSLRALCAESQANKTPVKLINCQVKQSGNQAPAEIVLTSRTKLDFSTKQFQLPASVDVNTATNMSLKTLLTLQWAKPSW